MSAHEPRSLAHRYHLLLALRWVPTGLMVTVYVLLLQARGLTLAQIGLGTAAQGAVMLVLELPTGGLADAVGRRCVAAAGALFSMAALGVLLVADSLPLLVLVASLHGVFRALDSGPLQCWYIDSLLLADPSAELERRLGRSEALVCASLGAGALLGSLVVAQGGLLGIDPLAAPIVLALAIQAGGLVAILRLVDEPHRRAPVLWTRAPGMRTGSSTDSVWHGVRQVPAIVRGAIRVVRSSRLLSALLCAEGLWGFGVIGFEVLMPPRMAQLTGGADEAATALGPVVAAAWVLSALGTAVAPSLSRRIGAAWTGFGLRLAHGATVLTMGLAAGPVGLAVAYLATYGVHGATNAVHYGMVHRAVASEHRATILSANSLASQVGFALSGIALGSLADATTLSTAMFVAAAVLAAAGPLYLVGRSRSDAVADPAVLAA